jgi:comEA protein
MLFKNHDLCNNAIINYFLFTLTKGVLMSLFNYTLRFSLHLFIIGLCILQYPQSYAKTLVSMISSPFHSQTEIHPANPLTQPTPILETSPQLPSQPSSPQTASPQSSSPEIQRIQLNKADVHTLTKIKGLSFKKAQSIVHYREVHGPFKSLEELKKVKGLGKKVYAKIVSYLAISE